ncbi:putative ABC transport system permease protein [Lysinibacillus composti]|uniref:ABC transporter permease n=1 Tax=Lysinibacillus composti TaxID=720633 RepID=A0A3N9UEX2_9BACI|nr:FtsX-like permease family protein [Lysinibacillus composti]MBM7608803.1 putative ABC transport system permease protein [Lysinibacillus composti]RQW74705.1 ABC transporter permease [Lysinibacillus composti]
MNIINKVTIRHLKQNKRRSLVTIIGVIISVAMITAVSTLGVSFLDLLARVEINKSGEWHVQYNDVTLDQIQAIDEDSNTKSLILSNDGYAVLEDSNNEFKPYIYLKNYNPSGMEHFPIEVIEGRLPRNENEIAISEAIKSNANIDFKIGDQLSFDIGERVHKTEGITLTQNDPLQRLDDLVNEELKINENKAVKVVGIIERPTWEPTWSPGYTAIGYVDEKSLSQSDTVDAFVVLRDIKTSLFEHAKSLAQTHGIEKVNYNSELLRYYGVTNNDDLRSTLFSLAAIVMGVIIIGSVALIYNAFAISVSERSRHLGMLSSVGATKKQKRNSVFFEGAVIGAISIPIGILAGIAGIGITFMFINTSLQGALGVSEKLELVATPASILIAIVISIVTIFISTYIPAQKASKISAIDAIRQTHDIKLSDKNVKTSILVRKLFGLEGEIGLKNVKRNRKRYLATLFSLVISIVLFLTVSYFTESLKKSLEMTQNDIQFDIQIMSSKLGKDELVDYTKLDYVTNSSMIEEVQLNALIGVDELPDQLKSQIQENDSDLEDGKYPFYAALSGLDQDSFIAFAEQIGVDADEFLENDTPLAIVIDQISYQDYATGKFIESEAIETEVGNKIDLYTTTYGDMENDETTREFMSSVQIGALTDQIPMGIQTASLGGINIIVPETTMDKFSIPSEEKTTYVILNSSDPMATQEVIEDQKNMDIYVYNVQQQRQQEEQIILFLSVFTYGFITLISLISVANIFNTISTSIALRKREFAMLRSVGLTPKGFNKMIRYESIFYGVKALLYGLPISVLVMFGIHRSTNYTFEYEFTLPWMSILFVIIMIFLIVGAAMLYSISKVKNENIIDSLKQESI